MSISKHIFHILSVHNNAEVIETIMKQLRDHGYAAQSTVVADFNSFLKDLAKQSWDLLLIPSDLEGVSWAFASEQIRKLDNDILMMALVENHDPEQYTHILALGFSMVLPAAAIDTYACHIIGRELHQLKERRRLLRSEVGLIEVEKRCNILLESSRDAIAYVADGMHILVNPVYAQLFGYQDLEELYAVPLLDMVASESQAAFKTAFKNMASEDKPGSISVNCLRENGTQFTAKMFFNEAKFQGEACLQLLIRSQNDAVTQGQQQQTSAIVSVPEQDQMQDKMQALSRLDLATGLLNRYYFEQSLANVVQSVQQTDQQEQFYSLLYIQLYQYNKVRAKIGVEGIDLVGKGVADILRAQASDATMLARFSEDVYVVLVQDNQIETLSKLAQSLSDVIKEHLFDLESQTIQFSACIGIALLDDKIDSEKNLLSNAMQAAASVAKEKNGSGFHVFAFNEETEKIDVDNSEKKILSALDLQKAFDDDLFKILFQPIINLRGSTSDFYEVLLRRVNKDDGSFESPEAFLKTIESANLATIIDRWVIIQSVKTLVSRSTKERETKILINITAQSLADKTFAPWLSVALKTTDLKPGAVTFQVNQVDANQYLNRLQDLTTALKELNCQISVSRITGNAESDNVIKHVMLDYVKLDGQFTKNNHNDVVQSDFGRLIEKVHNRQIKSIATQVESPSVLSALWQIGVHYIQGYYLQPPMEDMSYDFSQEDDDDAEQAVY